MKNMRKWIALLACLSLTLMAVTAFAADADQPPDPAKPHWTRRVPWLLIAAVVLAGALFALLAFGAR